MPATGKPCKQPFSRISSQISYVNSSPGRCPLSFLRPWTQRSTSPAYRSCPLPFFSSSHLFSTRRTPSHPSPSSRSPVPHPHPRLHSLLHAPHPDCSSPQTTPSQNRKTRRKQKSRACAASSCTGQLYLIIWCSCRTESLSRAGCTLCKARCKMRMQDPG